MKRLYLMRHAEAIDQVPSGLDFERYLLPEGVFHAQEQARKLLLLGLSVPDLIKTSAAWRASQTATIFAAATDQKSFLEIVPELYNASAEILLKAIQQTEERVQNLLIIAHNFGISDLASRLTGKRFLLSPAGIVGIEFDCMYWQDVYFEQGEKVAYAA